MPRPKGFLVDGRFLRAQRENAGLTQDDIAARCGLTRSVIQKSERGGPLAPSTIAALCKGLGCSESSLILSTDWNRSTEDRVVSPFKPEAAPKIGTIWGQSREMLYGMPPRLLQVLALRNVARVLPAYAPRSAEAEIHFRNVVAAVTCALRTLAPMLGGRGKEPIDAEVAKCADDCYVAAGFAKTTHYEESVHAADAGFAVAIGASRVVESILLERRRASAAMDADHWRVIEFATSACHAAGHASVYLSADETFIRSATLDTHDLWNAEDTAAILSRPLWGGRDLPPPLKLFMDRFLREKFFPHDIRILLNRWVRRGFTSSTTA